MKETFSLTLDTPAYKGGVTINTGLFISGKWVKPVDEQKIECYVMIRLSLALFVILGAATGKVITAIQGGSSKDVDLAVNAAEEAYKTLWGSKNAEEFAALEALNCGKPFASAQREVAVGCVQELKYYAGWADKVHGKTIETTENKMAYTRREPYGVVAVIIPWNAPLPSELTPLTALKFASLVNEAGSPPGVVNIVNGYGDLFYNIVGKAMAYHPRIRKIAFTGSTLTGRKIQKASAKSNLKVVTLELGGKSPNIIFNDADLEQAIKWAFTGIFANMGQLCRAGSRVFVQEGIYDAFIKGFSAAAQHLQQNAGDPFSGNALHGPQVSSTQFNRIMGYINSGKTDGAQPNIFTEVKPTMKIAREEVFGPIGVVMKFKTEQEVIEIANDITYGLACGIFTENVSRAIRVAHALEAGTAWVNTYNTIEISVPFGGYKQSGIGREQGECVLKHYTQVKAVHINISLKL
ncbi:aldehyde dehydrogenase [Dendrothele bispora CBS 962.96]|uniref:Aldehyde dehydrogenase n=1 Tax=Dendrothele bispora (strain CBS 962.96) TaxID=1314807 RepID=A0A4S8LRI9_DENBC|nr:aldehyde dehydrogenase [Dendrothele bispora CBS 962.96]